MTNLNAAEKLRDERLRRAILQCVYLGSRESPTGKVSGRYLAGAAAAGLPSEWQFDDDRHALSLLRDLKDAALLNEHLGVRRIGERFTLDHASYSPTHLGGQLYREECPPVPGVYDERIMGGE